MYHWHSNCYVLITATPSYQLHNKGRNPTIAIVLINPYVCQRKGEEQLSNIGVLCASIALEKSPQSSSWLRFRAGYSSCANQTPRDAWKFIVHAGNVCVIFTWMYRIHTWKRTKNTRELVYWSVVLPILQLQWVQTYGQISSLSRTKSWIGLNLCCTITKTTSIKISKNAEILVLSLLLPCYYHSHERGEWRYCRGNSSWFHPFSLPCSRPLNYVAGGQQLSYSWHVELAFPAFSAWADMLSCSCSDRRYVILGRLHLNCVIEACWFQDPFEN